MLSIASDARGHLDASLLAAVRANGRGGPMVLIQVLLPTTAPVRDGSDHDTAAAFARTRRELVEAFDGVTAYLRAPAQGIWTAPDGHRERDDVMMVEVVTASFDREWWRAYAATLAGRFGQHTIHVRALAIQTLDDDL
jgi:hypothetical protein